MSLAAGAVAASADAKTIFETATFTGRRHRRIYRERLTLFRRRLHAGQDERRSPASAVSSAASRAARFSARSCPCPPQPPFPDFTPSTIDANSLAHVVFAAPSDTTDLTEKVDVTLGAGTCGIVFGSGAFGADGNGGLGGNNDSIGSPNFFTYFQFDADALGRRFAGRRQDYRLRRT